MNDDFKKHRNFNDFFLFRSRKRRGSETLSSDDSSVSDEAESSSFEQIRGHHHHARHSRSSHHHSSRRKLNFEQAKSSKQKGAQPQPGSSGVMTECTAALVLMNLSLPNGSASTTTTSVSDVEDGRGKQFMKHRRASFNFDTPWLQSGTLLNTVMRNTGVN